MGKWEMVRLSEIVDEAITGEWGTECDDRIIGTKVLRTTNFTNIGIINYDNVVSRNIPSSKVDKKKLKRHDIILEKSGGSDNRPVGRVVYFDNESDDIYLCNNFTQVLRIKQNIAFPKYVFLYLFHLHQNGTTEYLQNKTTGIRNLQVKRYMALEIFLPPLPVQRKIADVLDRASALIEKRKAQIEKLDLLIKSQFIEMFGDPVTNPNKFQMLKLGDLCSLITKGASPRWQGFLYTDDDTQTLFVTSENVREGYVDLSTRKYLKDEFNSKQKRSLLQYGDLLINIVGASIGRAACFDHHMKANINQAVALVRLSTSKVHSEYLLYYLNSPKALQMYNYMKSDVARANLSLQDINNLDILLPPLELQNQFASFVQRIKAQRNLLQKSLEKLELNYKSLMQKCFRGEIF